MEASGYVDIFATKGIEYLFILFFLLSLLFFWKHLHPPVKTLAPVSNKFAIFPSLRFHLEEGLFYHQGHSWAKPGDKAWITVGIDDFTQQLLGRPSAVQFPKIGSRIRQGEKGWDFRFGPREVAILSPVDGTVVSINKEVLEDPHLINRDPYGKGWLMKVEVPEMKKNLTNLLSGDLAKSWMQESAGNLQNRMTGDPGMTLQNKSVAADGIARSISPEGWENVAGEFLRTL